MSGSAAEGECDLTPMLDMVFQLITFFMLVSNFKAAAIDMSLKLPVVGSARPVETKGQEKFLMLNIDKAGETAIDICAYAAHMAALMGAHIIKVKPPTAHLSLDAAKKVYEAQKIDISTLAKRVEHVMQSSFNGKRIVVFSGGEAKDLDGVYEEVRGLRDGGANGSIIGRNTFQRPKEAAIEMLNKIIDIYLGKA